MFSQRERGRKRERLCVCARSCSVFTAERVEIRLPYHPLPAGYPAVSGLLGSETLTLLAFLQPELTWQLSSPPLLTASHTQECTFPYCVHLCMILIVAVCVFRSESVRAFLCYVLMFL